MPRPKRPPFGEGLDYVTCRLCRREFRAITASHLVRRHGADPEHPILEYKVCHSNAPTRSRETMILQRRALAAHFERIGRRWTVKRILRAIASRKATGRPLHYAAVLHSDLPLLKAADRFFGSWKAALARAGIRYESVRRTRRWTHGGILAAIRALGQPLRFHETQKIDGGLAAVAVVRFGSWKKACSAAGVELPRAWLPWVWSREKVISEIKRRARLGRSLTALALRREHLSGLLTAALREFGTWRRALDAARVEHQDHRRRPRKWTREIVLAALRSHADARGIVHWSRTRRRLGGIERAASKLFGSIETALREAGCFPRQRLFNQEELVALLRRIRKTHGYLSRSLVQQATRPGYDNPASAIQRIFGGIAQAKAAVGATENAARLAAFAREARRRSLDGLPAVRGKRRRGRA